MSSLQSCHPLLSCQSVSSTHQFLCPQFVVSTPKSTSPNAAHALKLQASAKCRSWTSCCPSNTTFYLLPVFRLCSPDIHFSMREQTLTRSWNGQSLVAVNHTQTKVPDRVSCQWAKSTRIVKHTFVPTAYMTTISLMQDALTFALTFEIQHSCLVKMRIDR